MKYTLLGLIALSGTSFGAIAISGVSGSGFDAGSIPAGSLVMFIMDSSSNGFLGSSFNGTLTSGSDPHILSANASTTTGGTFGGDLILGRVTVSTAGQIPFTLSIPDQSFSGLGRNFAIVYFPSLAGTFTGQIPTGTAYGIVQGTDWILPTGDGSYTASATNFADQSVLARVTQSGGVVNNANFGTATAIFTVGAIPEPSVALLGAVGALGLLRRRR